MDNFKERLYRKYVSSGQASINSEKDSKILFPERRHYINSLIDKHLNKVSKSAKIVDVACGNGAFVHFLQEKKFSNVQGFDMSAEQIELGQAYGISNLSFLEMESYLVGKDEEVQVYILMDVLEHLDREYLFRVLDILYKKLSTNGILIIHVPNAEGIFGMRVRYGDLTHELSFTQKIDSSAAFDDWI